MDEKRIVDFCRELNVLSNKYKISLHVRNDGIVIKEAEKQIIYTPVIPKSENEDCYIYFSWRK